MNTILQNLPLAFAIVFGTLMVLVGLLITSVGMVTLRRLLDSRRWPQVLARIVSCEVREVRCFEDQTMYKPEMRYSFAVGAGEATGSDIAFAGKLYPSREQALKAVSRYPVGMVVTARYNPADPAQAVLVRRGSVAGLILTVMGLALIILPLAVAQLAGLPAGWLGAALFVPAAAAIILAWRSGSRLSRARRSGIYPAPGTGSDLDVERLVSQGEKMLAIRLYRELHGTDLKTSRLRVEEIGSGLPRG